MKSILKQAPINLMAGVIVGFLSAITSLSFASLIFSTPPLTEYASIGYSSALIGSAVILTIVAFKSSSPLSIAGPQDTFAVIAAIIATHLIQMANLYPGGQDHLLANMIAVLVLMSLLLGVIMYLIGTFNLGRLVRYFPFPVMAGFLAGTGGLIFWGAITTVTGDAAFTQQERLFSEDLLKWFLPLVYAAATLYFSKKFNYFWMFPALLIMGFLLFYGYLFIGNISLAEANALGWMIGPFPSGNLAVLPSMYVKEGVNWAWLARFIPDYITLVIIGTVSLLLNTSSLEIIIKKEVDINQELKATGIANVIAGIFGGLGGYLFLSEAKLSHQIGAHSRVVGLIAGCTALSLMFVGTPVLSIFPKFVFAGILFYIGLDFTLEWLIKGAAKFNLPDYFVVLSIALAIVFKGFLTGLLLGFALSLCIFFIRYSRVNVVRVFLNGTQIHSNVDRNINEDKALDKVSNKILVFSGQNYLFFGNTYDIVARILSKLNQNGEETKFLILDFAAVNDIEVTGLMSFVKLLQHTREKHIQVIFSATPPKIINEITRFGSLGRYKIMKDLDRALEYCENSLLSKPTNFQKSAHVLLLEDLFPNIKKMEVFRSFFEEFSANKGRVIYQQHDKGDDLFFLASGMLEVLLNYNTAHEKRLKKMQAGTIVGEVALYTEQARSATVLAATDCLLYRLTTEALVRMNHEEPEMAIAIHMKVATILSTRLVHANRLINAVGPL